jgi:hypothetical protein
VQSTKSGQGGGSESNGMDVEEGFQDANLICSIEHVDGQGRGREFQSLI